MVYNPSEGNLCDQAKMQRCQWSKRIDDNSENLAAEASLEALRYTVVGPIDVR